MFACFSLVSDWNSVSFNRVHYNNSKCSPVSPFYKKQTSKLYYWTVTNSAKKVWFDLNSYQFLGRNNDSITQLPIPFYLCWLGCSQSGAGLPSSAGILPGIAETCCNEENGTSSNGSFTNSISNIFYLRNDYKSFLMIVDNDSCDIFDD
jgi:hypothetical protein